MNVLEGVTEALVEPLQHPLADGPNVHEDRHRLCTDLVRVNRHYQLSLNLMVLVIVPAFFWHILPQDLVMLLMSRVALTLVMRPQMH